MVFIFCIQSPSFWKFSPTRHKQNQQVCKSCESQVVGRKWSDFLNIFNQNAWFVSRETWLLCRISKFKPTSPEISPATLSWCEEPSHQVGGVYFESEGRRDGPGSCLSPSDIDAWHSTVNLIVFFFDFAFRLQDDAKTIAALVELFLDKQTGGKSCYHPPQIDLQKSIMQ